MTVWDHDSGQYLEVDSPVFTGPQATCTILDGAGREVRGNYLRDAAPAPGGMSHVRYQQKGDSLLPRTEHSKCGCGRRKSSSQTRCKTCQASGVNVERRKTPREGKAA